MRGALMRACKSRVGQIRVGKTVAALAASVWLAACGGVKVRPEQQLPRALMQPMNARVGLIVDEELRKYQHEETRSGGNWLVELGTGHEQLFRSILSASFATAQSFQSLDEARAATGLQALFQPRIEQYSFATARETSGEYWAVTIRYRIAVLTPQGEPVDALTLTGYGSARGAGGNSKSLTTATSSAMRDAASKFLVQMPHQSLAAKLVKGDVITAADQVVVAVDVIEAVPIEPIEPVAPPAGS
jgi:hypothetical protein